MAVLEIQKGTDNKILRAQSVEVKKIDAKIKKLIVDMIETMKDADGIGIAAPQVGVNLRIYIARLNFGTDNELIVPMLNPVFLEHSDFTEPGEEGCLSIPKKFGIVKRAKNITVKFMDIKGQTRVLELEDLNARIMQHETDHLNGTLIADKMEETPPETKSVR